MKMCAIFLNLAIAASASAQIQTADANNPHPRVGKTTIDGQHVTVLHLKPGYVSSIRLPEEVSSVVLGDPRSFRAEHSDAEPRLVFFKTIVAKPCETNALISTKSGHEVSLDLISDPRSLGPDEVDFFIDYERPRSFLIQTAAPAFLINESRSLDIASPVSPEPRNENAVLQAALTSQSRVAVPDWAGTKLQVAVGAVTGNHQQMLVRFSVCNNSDKTIELLPPQVQLSGPSRRGSKTIKAEQIPIEDYAFSLRRLPPGARADGVVVFERPSFKESSEQLLLEVAQAEGVDHPLLLPIPFTAPLHAEAQ